ncbi:hypothetical protein ABEB36_007902, partial [Hypothenemus hampei]
PIVRQIFTFDVIDENDIGEMMKNLKNQKKKVTAVSHIIPNELLIYDGKALEGEMGRD